MNERTLRASPSWVGEPAEPSQLVLQKASYHTGPLIGDRYQVHGESPRSWYIVDHCKTDLLVRVAGTLSDVLRFKTREEAENWCTNALGGRIASPAQTQESDMSRKAVIVHGVEVSDGKFPVVAKRGGPKATLTEENTKKPTSAERKAFEADVKAKLGVKAKAIKDDANGQMPRSVKDVSKRIGTVASRFRELIAKPGKMTDAQIHAKVEEEFGKKIPKNAVAYYRADLERRQTV
jgi:hypothetical protein